MILFLKSYFCLLQVTKFCATEENSSEFLQNDIENDNWDIEISIDFFVNKDLKKRLSKGIMHD